jgi:ribosome biogenesis GTPase / thiamine phosphate phosphatase
MSISELSSNVKEIFSVSRIFGAYYEIYHKSYGSKQANLRGRLRLEFHSERNPLAVGDLVYAYPAQDSDNWVIDSRLERRNFLIRKSDKGDTHVLCANIDQVCIIASLSNPETKTGFIDRAIAATFHSHVPTLVVFSKSDLVDSTEVNLKLNFYRNSGFECIAVSLQDEESLKHLQSKLSGKTSYLVGNSGVGKSSLLNSLKGEEIQKVDKVSVSTQKGKHTTTNSYAFHLSEDMTLIDSPGIKEWGLLHLEKNDIFECFPSFLEVKDKCEVFHCCELAEGCAMLNLLYSENFSKERRDNILSMLDGLETPYRLRKGNFISGKRKKEKKDFSSKTKSKRKFISDES